MKNVKQKYILPIVWTAVILSAVIVITLCSKCSPLYALNDWDDPNCFFTVGKAVVHDMVLYRDIFEQKGPILYFIHSFAYLISEKSFLGVYFLELISAAVFLLFSYKTVSLFCRERAVLCIPLTAAAVFGSYAFQGGDSAEEFILPFGAYCIYTALSAVTENRKLKFTESLVIGFSIGMALWIKFTLMGIFIGFVLAFIILYIQKKQIKDIFLTALYMITGLIICSAPVIIYCAVTNSFDSMYEVYFYDNLFLYGTGGGIPFISNMINLFIGVGALFQNHPFALIFAVSGIIHIIKMKNKQLSLVYMIILAAAFIFTYAGGRYYAYYSLIISLFIPVGEIGLITLKPKQKKIFAYLTYILVICAGIIFCPNFSRLGKQKSDYPQFRFNEHISKKENATLLNYNFLDGGFYTVSGIVPNCRFFCGLNLPYDEIGNVQKRYVDSGMVDFIITKDEKPVFPLYECIDECEFPYGNSVSKYYLYAISN